MLRGTGEAPSPTQRINGVGLVVGLVACNMNGKRALCVLRKLKQNDPTTTSKTGRCVSTYLFIGVLQGCSLPETLSYSRFSLVAGPFSLKQSLCRSRVRQAKIASRLDVSIMSNMKRSNMRSSYILLVRKCRAHHLDTLNRIRAEQES